MLGDMENGLTTTIIDKSSSPAFCFLEFCETVLIDLGK